MFGPGTGVGAQGMTVGGPPSLILLRDPESCLVRSWLVGLRLPAVRGRSDGLRGRLEAFCDSDHCSSSVLSSSELRACHFPPLVATISSKVFVLPCALMQVLLLSRDSNNFGDPAQRYASLKPRKSDKDRLQVGAGMPENHRSYQEF